MARQIDLLNLEGGERILDAGCGTGNFLTALLDGTGRPDDPRLLPREVTLVLVSQTTTLLGAVTLFTRAGST